MTTKLCAFVFILLATLAGDLYAQTPAQVPRRVAAQVAAFDNFDSELECTAAVQGNRFSFYRPGFTSTRALGPNEGIFPHPTGGCFLMTVQESRMMGRRDVLPGEPGLQRWVPIQAGTDFVWRLNPVTVAPEGVIKLAQCDNDIFGDAPFGGGRVTSPVIPPQEDVFVQAPAPRIRRETIETAVRDTPFERQVTVVDDRNWFERNWPWAVPVIGAAIVGTACAFDHCPFNVTQETRVHVGSGSNATVSTR